jgi:TonB family protein
MAVTGGAGIGQTAGRTGEQKAHTCANDCYHSLTLCVIPGEAPTMRFCKHAATRCFWFLFLLSTLSSAQPSAALKPDSGAFTNGAYSNDYFRFTYTVGEGWYINQDLMTQGANSTTKLAGHFLLMVLDRHTGGPMRERVLMMADDANVYRSFKSAADYAAKFLDAQVKGQHMERVRDVFPTEHAGRTFYCGEFNEPYSGGALHKAFVATERSGFLLSWSFVASSAEELDVLLQSLGEIRFAPQVAGEATKAAENATSSIPPKRIRISQMVLDGYISEKPIPPYPDEARKNRIQGLVRLHVLISGTGRLEKADVLEGDPVLSRAALDGVRYWRFRPYLLNGEPVEVDSQITIDFKLSKSK